MLEKIIIFSVEYLYLLVAGCAIVFVLFSALHTKKKDITRLGVLSFAIGLLLDKVLNAVIFSPRPFVVENVSPIVPHVADNGFPSEHALFVMLIAGIIFVFHKKMGILLSILALIIGIGSILAKVHYPIDVLGSVLIAFVSVLVSTFIISRFGNRGVSTSRFDNTP